MPADEFTSTLFPLLVAKERGAVIREVAFDEVAAADHRLDAARRVQPRPDADRPGGRPRGDPRAPPSDTGRRSSSMRTQGVPFVDLEPVIGRIDYLVCSGYKHLLSPRGTAYLYVRRDRWDSLEPLNANWRAADAPFGRYFGGPLTLMPDARRFEVSRGWFPWVGATASLGLLTRWKADGAFPAVRSLAAGLADRLGVPWYGSSLVCAPLGDGEAAGRRWRRPASGRRCAARRSASRSTSTRPRRTSIAPPRPSPRSRTADAQRRTGHVGRRAAISRVTAGASAARGRAARRPAGLGRPPGRSAPRGRAP